MLLFYVISLHIVWAYDKPAYKVTFKKNNVCVRILISDLSARTRLPTWNTVFLFKINIYIPHSTDKPKFTIYSILQMWTQFWIQEQ